MKKHILITAVLLALLLSSCQSEAPDASVTVNDTAVEATTDSNGQIIDYPLNFTESKITASSFNEAGEGKDAELEAWVSTAFVDISEIYGFSYLLAAHKNVMSVSFYDADGKYISGIGTTSMLSHATTVCGFAVRPENAVTARFVNFTGKDDLPEFDEPSVKGYRTEAEYTAASSLGELSGLKIACLGDSLTEGDYGGQRGVANRKLKNYPYYLALETGAETVNYGKCGANASSYLKNYYEAGLVDVTDADVVLLMLGTNLGLERESNYYKDYLTLIDKIQADMKSGAKLILITPPSSTIDDTKVNFGYMQWVTTAYGSVMAAAKEKGLDVIDAYKYSPIRPDMEETYQANDGLHMNEDGYKAFAGFISHELILRLK